MPAVLGSSGWLGLADSVAIGRLWQWKQSDSAQLVGERHSNAHKRALIQRCVKHQLAHVGFCRSGWLWLSQPRGAQKGEQWVSCGHKTSARSSHRGIGVALGGQWERWLSSLGCNKATCKTSCSMSINCPTHEVEALHHQRAVPVVGVECWRF